MSPSTSTQLVPASAGSPGPAPRRNRFSRAVRAAVSEIFGLVEPAPAEPAPAGRRVARAAYAGAETTRFNLGWRASNEAADDDIRGSMLTLRARARELARNNAYIQRYRGLLLANVLGPDGVGHQAQVRLRGSNGQPGELDEAVNDVIEAGWRDYCRGPVTVDGKHSMLEFQSLQLETAAVDGEAFTRTFVGRNFRYGLGLQPIDPDLVAENFDWRGGPDGNEVRLGVEVDTWGAPAGYYVWDWPRYTPGSRERGLQRLPASEILHHYRSHRAHQTRGVTWLASVMTEIQDLAGYEESVIIGARAGANQVAVTQWKDASTAPAPANHEAARKPVQMDLNPGTITELDPGLEMVPFDPKQPTGVYGDFTKTRLRTISSGLLVAYSSLSGDLREVNYSSAKIGLQEEREEWKMLQEWLIASQVQPIYYRWLQSAILSGALPLPNPDWRAYAAVSWHPRRWPWIEPQREIGATQTMIELGLTSRQRVLAEQSDGDYRKLVEELEQEQKIASDAGISVMPSNATPAKAPPADEPTDAPADEPADDDEPAARSRRVRPANRVAALARQPAPNGHGGR